MDPLASALERSPELFPFDLDPATDQATLIRLTEADYQRASFLDGRILTPQTPRRAVPWPHLEAAVAAAPLAETAGYIFHIGHVGSTLVSRLLGAHARVFAVREPAILRTSAEMCFEPEAPARQPTGSEGDQLLGTILKLLSRTFHPEQRAIIKATSFVSELAAPILVRRSRPKAIFMFVPAETYLATILGAPNSPREARLLAESRLRRIHARIGGEHWRVAELRQGELVAMSWACEMTALAAAADEARERVVWVNFNRFLESTAASLRSAACHLGVEATELEVETILSGPALRQYAKAPEFPYNPAVRDQVLNQARKDQAPEIAHGLSWLDRAGTQSAAISTVLALR